MGPFQEVQLVAGRELRKTFRSAKGLILAALTLAGGGGFSVLFAWIARLRTEQLPNTPDAAEMAARMQEQLYTQVYGADTGKFLLPAPYALLMMAEATLALAPLLVALIGFDAVSAELQHRTVRFWVVRSRRASYVAGKFLGLWFAVVAVLLAMNLVVWTAIVVVGHEPVEHVVRWGAGFFVVVVPVSAAWCGIATLVGSQFRVPILALMSICAAMFGLLIVRGVAGFARVDALAYVYPNAYDHLLLSPHASEVALGFAGPLLIAAATTAAAALAFERRDL
jgi:ABC-type transport system involved in multi-copper enzyme maturation permease subunit